MIADDKWLNDIIFQCVVDDLLLSQRMVSFIYEYVTRNQVAIADVYRLSYAFKRVTSSYLFSNVLGLPFHNTDLTFCICEEIAE